MFNNDDARHLNPRDADFERSLRSLQPASGKIDPVAAAFTAGRHSRRVELRAWRTAATVVVVAGVGLWQFGRDDPQLAERPTPEAAPVIQVVTTPPHPAEPPAVQSVLMMRRAVMDSGLAGVAAPDLPRHSTQNEFDVF